MTLEEEAARMHALFRGNENAYGTFKLGDIDETGKITGIAATVKGKPVTDELWLRHLKGEIGLGIVPIDQNNSCRWGCIDVDEYPPQISRIQAAIERHKFPLYVFLSKSGGCHLILFAKSSNPAKAMRDCLQAMAAALGLGDKEIFPKQTVKGAVGNWLNMPYFDKARPCLSGNTQLTRAAFLDYVKPVDKLPKVISSVKSRFPDGPPCLQTLAEYGPVGDHQKHDYLFAIGTYLKMADKEHWASQLRMCNSDTTLLPNGHTGIEQLIEDLSKTDYEYRCKQPPINKYCNRALCLTRKNGVAKGRCIPTSLVYYGDGRTTTTFVTVWSKGKEHEISVTTQELLDPTKFMSVCVDRIHDYPPILKRNDWLALLDTLPKTSMWTGEMFEDNLFDKLQQFCLNNKTEDRADLLLIEKRVLFERKRKRVYFKAAVVAQALGISTGELEKFIRQHGGNNAEQLALPNNINRRFSWLPMDNILAALPEPKVPEAEDDPI